MATPLSSLPPSQKILGWWWIRTSQWCPISISWFNLVFIRCDRFDRSLTFDAARKLICTLTHVLTTVSLFAELQAQSIDRLQSILNTSARLACGLHKYDHITPALRDRLHWLPMKNNESLTSCLLTFKGLQGEAPSYIIELCKRVNTIESPRRLRSAASGKLIDPRTFTDFGKRALTYAGPSAWTASFWTETVIYYFVILRSKNFPFSFCLRHWNLRNCFGIRCWCCINNIIHIVVKSPCAVLRLYGAI